MKHLLPRSLMGRSLLILIIPVVVVQLITAIVFFDRHWGRVIGNLSFALAGEIALLAGQLEGGANLTDQAILHLDLDVDYTQDAVLADAGAIDADFGWEMIVADVFAQKLQEQLGRDFSLHLLFEEKWAFVDVQLADGVMRVSFPQRRLFSSSGYIFLLWVLGAALLLLLIAILFMRNQIRPIRKLSVAAERFGRGRDVGSFKPEGAREVRQAGAAFLGMRKRIKRQVEQRTLMLAGVSHDLRTPLTRMKLALSMMDQGNDDVRAMCDDLSDMQRMIDGYLDFVRGEHDQEPVGDVHLSVLMKKIAGDADHISLSLDDFISLQGRALALERCLQNIINNAQAHASYIKVSCFMDEDKRAHIIIEDDGPGITEDQYEDVFRPFFRLDQARDTQGGSVGLGLPIAMDVVLSHGGRIWLDRSAKLGGLAVHIRLPL